MRFRSAGWLTAIVIAGLLAYGCINLMNMKSKVDEAAKRLAMAQSSVKRADENLRMANLGFSEGVVTPTVVMEATEVPPLESKVTCL